MDRDQPGKPPGLVASLHPPTPAGSSVLDPAVVKSLGAAFRGGVRFVGRPHRRGNVPSKRVLRRSEKGSR